jgi:hypothetical protein
LNKPKKQGTAAESRIVTLHTSAGLSARRLAEGGSTDEGDVEVFAERLFWIPGINDYEPMPYRVVGEVKDRERLNTAEALDKAVRKSGTLRTALFVTQRYGEGLRRKTRRFVAIPEGFWLELAGGRDEAR